jgi:hypothetical protein
MTYCIAKCRKRRHVLWDELQRGGEGPKAGYTAAPPGSRSDLARGQRSAVQPNSPGFSLLQNATKIAALLRSLHFAKRCAVSPEAEYDYELYVRWIILVNSYEEEQNMQKLTAMEECLRFSL